MTLTDGKGGDIIFKPGKGVPNGAIIFRLADGTEMLRIGADGGFYVRGEKVNGADDVAMALRIWIHALARTRGG